MDEVYEDKILSFFRKWIKSFCNIDCFAVLIILPNNEMLHLSTHPNLTKVYGQKNYGLFDQPTKSDIYEKFSFYPWRLPNPNTKQQEIHTVREKIFNLNSGTNFVRKITNKNEEYYVIYCVSSHSKDLRNYFEFSSNANLILQE
ncbi:hypothetical protein [Piscirickettsia salmonis]|nr:hypothetical protein [Piscirickettsia salmonis]